MASRFDLGPKPRLGYTHSRIERAADRRPDAAAINALAADPRARSYVMGGEMIVLKKAAPLHEAVFTLAETRALGPALETIFLGLVGGAARFGVGLPADGQAATHANGGTIGFAAQTKEQVDAFHAAGLANGGTCAGEPGKRPGAPGNAYGAYLRDPTGNKICTFCQLPEGE